MNRAEKNLAFWKRLVGLEASFPMLADVGDDADLLDLVLLDEQQFEAIRSSLATHQLTQVLIEPGWGCTTLFRYMVKEARDHAMLRLLLPISIDLETLFKQDAITYAGLEHEIKQQIIGLLINNPWEQSLNHDYYFECINYDSSTDLAHYKHRMSLFLADRPPSSRRLLGQFPWLKGNLNDHLNYCLSNFRIQTALYFHFPRGLEPQRIRDLVISIKATNETGSVDYAARREVYFCSPRQRSEIERDFARSFNVLHYPRYTAAQIYAMLVKRYRPNVPGFRSRNQVPLKSVFSEAFVHEAWRDAQSLQDVVRKMHEAMLRRLDCPEANVPFELAPMASAASTNGELSAEPVPSPSERKRFERKPRRV